MDQGFNILIVDDDQRMTHTLADILAVSGYHSVEARSPAQAIDQLRQERFDCVLTDVRMPDMDGTAFYRLIHQERPGLPVILMTAYSTDETIHQGLEEGVIGVMEKPLNISQLLGFFSVLVKNHTIAVVDDDPGFCATLADILRKRGFYVQLVTDPPHRLDEVSSEAQVVLLDLKLNCVSGLDLLKQIRQNHANLPVLLITAYREEMAEAIKLAQEYSAFTCLYKPFEMSDLLRILEEIQLTRLRDAISSVNSSLDPNN